jgi:hypothetical protein
MPSYTRCLEVRPLVIILMSLQRDGTVVVSDLAPPAIQKPNVLVSTVCQADPVELLLSIGSPHQFPGSPLTAFG